MDYELGWYLTLITWTDIVDQNVRSLYLIKEDQLLAKLNRR